MKAHLVRAGIPVCILEPRDRNNPDHGCLQDGTSFVVALLGMGRHAGKRHGPAQRRPTTTVEVT